MSASGWASDNEKEIGGPGRRRVGPVHELPRLPRRQYQSERTPVRVGVPVPPADAALDVDVAAARRPLRRALRAGEDFDIDALRSGPKLGPDGVPAWQ